MMLISIIVPVYNVEKFLNRCVDSIINQTYTDWELILIDDGSKDLSSSICDEYASKYEKINVYHLENGGVSRARNFGINHAQGEWVTFIDSDDYVNADFLLKLSNEGHLNYDTFYSSGIQYITPDGKRIDMFKYSKKTFSIDNVKEIYDSDILANGCPVAKLFNRNIIISNNIYFNESLSLNEDHIFVIDYLRYISKVFLSENIDYNYWFDYRIPSLTKINHSSEESLLAASSICVALDRLCKKFNFDKNSVVSFKNQRIFGTQQIFRAAISSLFEVDTFEKISNCSELINDLKLSINSCFGLEKLILQSLSDRRIKKAIFLCRIYFVIYSIKRKSVNIIKNLLRKYSNRTY